MHDTKRQLVSRSDCESWNQNVQDINNRAFRDLVTKRLSKSGFSHRNGGILDCDSMDDSDGLVMCHWMLSIFVKMHK